MWKKCSYPSLKPLGSWVNDLLTRLNMFNDWIKNDKPTIYWISGFYFTQAFITGTRQNLARKYTIPIDEIEYSFRVLTPEEGDGIGSDAPEDGAYVNGLFIEGCGWDFNIKQMIESNPRELYVSMPVIHLLPANTKDINHGHSYLCPVYKTSERRGMLSTTGHS